MGVPGGHPEGQEGNAAAGAAENESVEFGFVADPDGVDPVSRVEGCVGGEGPLAGESLLMLLLLLLDEKAVLVVVDTKKAGADGGEDGHFFRGGVFSCFMFAFLVLCLLGLRLFYSFTAVAVDIDGCPWDHVCGRWGESKWTA